MRARLLLGWLVGAALVIGCDTTQPIRQEQQMIELSFRATSATVQEIWTWRVFEDSDGNGLPDDSTGDGVPDEYLWCEPQARYVGSDMPWSHSVQVDIIRGGTTEVVTIARETEPNATFALYDPSTGGTNNVEFDDLLVTNRDGRCSFNQNIICNPDNLPGGDPPTTICEIEGAGTCRAVGTCSIDSGVSCFPDDPVDSCVEQGLGTCDSNPRTRTFVFDPLRKFVSGASYTILGAELNIVYITDPTEAESVASVQESTGGRCPGTDLGPSNVGGNEAPWSFAINKGDTINVQARRFSELPDGFANGANPPLISAGVVYVLSHADPISAEMLVDGRQVGVSGTTATSPGDVESAIDFFFTSK